MKLSILIASLVLLSVTSASQSRDVLVATVMVRQTTGSVSEKCNNTCAVFESVKNDCGNVPHCGCNEKYMQAQGECLLCQTGTPEDAASVKMFLDAEMVQCHRNGIPIGFKLQLPPDAQTVVDELDRQSATLRHQQMAFLALHIIGGHVGLVIILTFAIFSRKVHRDPTFLNFCITWIISSVVYSILLYRGTEGNSIANSLSRFSPNECLMQASLINGAQAMTACSTTALVLQLWIGLRVAIYGDLRGRGQKQWTTIILLLSPYVVFIAFAVPSIVFGGVHISTDGVSIQRALPSNFYCVIVELKSFLQAIYGVTFGFLVVAAIFDVLIIIELCRLRWVFQNMNARNGFSLSILIRVIVFSVYRILIAVAYGTILRSPQKSAAYGSASTLSISFFVAVWVDLLQATIPLVAFLIFGLNTDVITSLMLWRRKKGTHTSVQALEPTDTRTVYAAEGNQNKRTRDTTDTKIEGGCKTIKLNSQHVRPTEV